MRKDPVNIHINISTTQLRAALGATLCYVVFRKILMRRK